MTLTVEIGLVMENVCLYFTNDGYSVNKGKDTMMVTVDVVI